MQLVTQQDCDAANNKFNGFHDGFLRELPWQSSMRFAASMPWEQQRSFSTNEERLKATGMTPLGDDCVSLFISHYNYDWPNQPNKRIIAIHLFRGIWGSHQFSSCLVIRQLVFAKLDKMFPAQYIGIRSDHLRTN